MNRTFKVSTTTVHEFREGWGVVIHAIWDDSDDPFARVSDIDVSVVEIVEANVKVLGNTPCVMLGPKSGVPLQSFKDLPDLRYDDHHDLRTRWFATEEGARAHARYVEERWAHPEPWCVFVALS